MVHDALYDSIGARYAPFRVPDPHLARAIAAAVGPAVSVVNVGAGAGSYEPPGCFVAAVEPSLTMIRQRPSDAGPCASGIAEALPLTDACVDAALAIFTLHHWVAKGLGELARVARRRIVVVTIDPPYLENHWLVADYAPEIMDSHATSFQASRPWSTFSRARAP